MNVMTVQSLAAEVKRQQALIKDFVVVPHIGFEMVPTGHELAIGKCSELPMGQYAHDDLSEFTGIDRPYYRRMLKEKPELLATNVNRWLEDMQDKRRFVRTLEGSVRCIKSNKFRPLDNAHLMEAALPALYQYPDIKIQSCNMTEARLYLKAVLPRLEFEVRKGDIVQFGLTISNSEIGHGSLEVAIFALRLICLNGAVIEDGKFRRSHIGGRLGSDNAAEEYFADETRRAADAAFFLKLRDSVKFLLTEAACEDSVEKMRRAAGERIEARPDKAVKEVSKRYGLGEEEQTSVLEFLLRGGDMTKWGMMNAITRAAQEIEDYDRQTELERMGGKVLELEGNEWAKVAA